jgi:hypothetical protein
MKDFTCWVLDVILWENYKDEIIGISCIPWVCKSTKDPNKALLSSLGNEYKGESVMVELLHPHSVNVFVTVKTEEEG